MSAILGAIAVFLSLAFVVAIAVPLLLALRALHQAVAP